MSHEIYRPALEEIFGDSVESISNPERETKNNCFVVAVKGQKYFIKFSDEKNIDRETRAHKFYDNNALLNVPSIVRKGKNYIVYAFEEGLKEFNVDRVAIELALFHKRSLDFPDFIDIECEPSFSMGKSRERAKRRIIKYDSFLRKICDDSSKLLELLNDTEHSSAFQKRILAHGDPHRWNILQRANGKPVFLDYEFVTYTEPTFDVARCIVSENPDSFKTILTSYSSVFPEIGKVIFVESVLHDVICQAINRAVSFQKIDPSSHRTERRLNKLRSLLEVIFE